MTDTPEIDVDALAAFLEALDEWGCTDNEQRAKEVADFIRGGCNMSAYEERDLPEFTRVQ